MNIDEKPTKFIRRREVEKRIGRGHTWIYDQLDDPSSDFPRPIRPNPSKRNIVWVESEVEAWMQKRIEPRLPRCAPPQHLPRPQRHNEGSMKFEIEINESDLFAEIAVPAKNMANQAFRNIVFGQVGKQIDKFFAHGNYSHLAESKGLAIIQTAIANMEEEAGLLISKEIKKRLPDAVRNSVEAILRSSLRARVKEAVESLAISELLSLSGKK